MLTGSSAAKVDLSFLRIVVSKPLLIRATGLILGPSVPTDGLSRQIRYSRPLNLSLRRLIVPDRHRRPTRCDPQAESGAHPSFPPRTAPAGLPLVSEIKSGWIAAAAPTRRAAARACSDPG